MNQITATERSVAVGRDVISSVIISGSDNVVYMQGDRGLLFYALDENYRAAQKERRPADFYNGTRPNWANIANAHDAPRALYHDLYAYATADGEPYQRIGLVLGLAGEGKTTLLMRLAWSLAEEGYTVLWHHSGFTGMRSVTGEALTTPRDRPLILCFDQADQVEALPLLVKDLAEQGLRFVILGTTRPHEWRAAEMEGHLRDARLKKFGLATLTGREVNALLDKLAEHNALDRLANLSRREQVKHFLSRLEADRQLLPALLTAKRQAESFESIVLDVLENVRRRKDGEFLIRAYATLAAVHRFDFWLSRSLFARALDISVSEVGTRILSPLVGELLEVTQADDERLYTRHPVIAERVFALATVRKGWVESRYVYSGLLQALAEHLQAEPECPERKLLTMLPLALIRQGDFTAARRLFRQGVQADPTHAPTWQAWALMEKSLGNPEEARRLFKQGVQADPTHAPLWQAWALMELKKSGPERALALLDEGLRKVKTKRGRAKLLSLRGQALARMGLTEEAEVAFREALALDKRNWHTHYHYAHDLLERAGRREEACAHYRRVLALKPRRRWMRENAKKALQRLGCRKP